MNDKFDDTLSKILKEETAKEKAKKKKKPIFKLKKEKPVMYYSGWHKGKNTENSQNKSESQKKLV